MSKRTLGTMSSQLLVAAALCLVSPFTGTALTASAQGVGSSGEIRGTATDATGAAVPGVTITASDKSIGSKRTAVTDATGQYVITGLSPSTYDVTAEMRGFATEIGRGVTVSIGQTTGANFQLKVSTVSSEIEVTDAPPVIEAERGGQSETISQRDITNLPISRRDYLTFSLLLPGVSNSNTIASNADYRVKQTPQSGLSLYGSNGRGNSVTVDGGEANDDAGGVRLNVSQDAVQEFQINRSNYTAAEGGASGAAINIVTKSGTDNLHGGLFTFVRNSAMDARNPFAYTSALQPGQAFSLTAQGRPIKNQLSREQFGGTLGAPIRKNKTFLFVAFEGLHSDAQNSVPLLTNTNIFAPTAAQAPILAGLEAEGSTPVPCMGTTPATFVFVPANLCGFGLQSALTVNPNANPFNSAAKPPPMRSSSISSKPTAASSPSPPVSTRPRRASISTSTTTTHSSFATTFRTSGSRTPTCRRSPPSIAAAPSMTSITPCRVPTFTCSALIQPTSCGSRKTSTASTSIRTTQAAPGRMSKASASSDATSSSTATPWSTTPSSPTT